MAMKTQAYISRVLTEANIADDPSRESYTLLKAIGVRCVETRLDERFWNPTAWEALSLRMHSVPQVAPEDVADHIA